MGNYYNGVYTLSSLGGRRGYLSLGCMSNLTQSSEGLGVGRDLGCHCCLGKARHVQVPLRFYFSSSYFDKSSAYTVAAAT